MSKIFCGDLARERYFEACEKLLLDTGVIGRIIEASDKVDKSIIIKLEEFNTKDEFVKVQQAAEALDFHVTGAFSELDKKKISW